MKRQRGINCGSRRLIRDMPFRAQELLERNVMPIDLVMIHSALIRLGIVDQ